MKKGLSPATGRCGTLAAGVCGGRSNCKLTVENHLERDPRIEHWFSAGIGRSYLTEEWVGLILSINPTEPMPEYLSEMYERAQGCAVYGCYHYPLFTLSMEELLRFQESALCEAVRDYGASDDVLRMTYFNLLKWTHNQGLIDQQTHDRWQASRSLRNTTSHKRGHLRLGPNHAISKLEITSELTDALFRACRYQPPD